MRKHALFALSALALVIASAGAARAADKLQPRAHGPQGRRRRSSSTSPTSTAKVVSSPAAQRKTSRSSSTRRSKATPPRCRCSTSRRSRSTSSSSPSSARRCSRCSTRRRAPSARSPTRCRPSRRWRCSATPLDTKRLSEMGSPVDAESAAKTMSIDADSPEMHMLNAVRTALDLLAAAPKGERKLIVIFSDGIDADMEPRTFTSIGKRAAEAGVVIDTIGYNEFDAGKLRTLGILAKQSMGMERVCKTVERHLQPLLQHHRRDQEAVRRDLRGAARRRRRQAAPVPGARPRRTGARPTRTSSRTSCRRPATRSPRRARAARAGGCGRSSASSPSGSSGSSPGSSSARSPRRCPTSSRRRRPRPWPRRRRRR